MSVIVVNPSDMSGQPDFNILNDNVVKTVNYGIQLINFSNKDVETINVTYTSSDGSSGYINTINYSNGSTIIYFADYVHASATNLFYYVISKSVVDIGDIAENVDINTITATISDDWGYVSEGAPKGYPESVEITEYFDSTKTDEDALLVWGEYDSLGNYQIKDQYVYPTPSDISKPYSLAIVQRLNDNQFVFYILSFVMAVNNAGSSTIYYSPSLHNYDIQLKTILTQEKTVVDNDNPDFNLEENELTTDRTKYGSTQISKYISDNIKDMYANGKQTVTLTTYYCEYKDTDGNIVYNGKDGKMIKVGDTIRPMIRKDDQLIPLSKYQNYNTPRDYLVVSSDVSYNGKIKNTITCVENVLESKDGQSLAIFSKIIDGSIVKITNWDISGLTSLCNYALAGCYNLQLVEIPETVKSLGSKVFYGCNSLQTIKLYSLTPPDLSSADFPDNITKIYIPSGSLNNYSQATNWSTYTAKMEEY